MYYFASDTHLGAGSIEEQKATEKLFVQWLDRVSADAKAIFLCGDIFDFWFEYKRVVPKGFVRTFAKIAELTERGIRIVFLTGNHDLWVRDYLTVECGAEIYTHPTTFSLSGIEVHIAHGDNLNVKGNFPLQFMNSVFHSKSIRVLFSALVHPDLALKFGQWWSGSSRKKHTNEDPERVLRSMGFLEEYALGHFAEHHNDIYIFGHLHHTRFTESEKGERGERPTIIFMNDWSSDPHYISLDDDGVATLCSVK